MDGDGLFYRGSTVRIGDVTDGTSSTLAAGERSFLYADAAWVGSVTGAQLVPNPGSGLTVQLDVAANYVLGHTGESFNGPGGRNEPNSFYSNHVRGVNFVFADGHVQFISQTIDMNAYQFLSTYAGGEVIPGNAY